MERKIRRGSKRVAPFILTLKDHSNPQVAGKGEGGQCSNGHECQLAKTIQANVIYACALYKDQRWAMGMQIFYKSLQFAKQHICGLIPLSQICTFLRYASPEIANPHFLGLIRKTQKINAQIYLLFQSAYRKSAKCFRLLLYTLQ